MKNSHRALYEFGYSFFSPIFNHYVRRITEYTGEYRAVCLAREGWVFFKLLTHLQDRNLIQLQHAPLYLKVSRTLLFRSQLGNPYVWDAALKGIFEGSVLSLLMKRFGLQQHELTEWLPAELLSLDISLPDDKDTFMQWMAPHNERLQACVTPTRTAVSTYFEREGLLQGPSPLMLDLGYAGTIQKLITRMIERDTSGLYFIANEAGDAQVGKHTAHLRGVFKENVKWSEGYLMLERSLLLETLMTAPHGQVIDIRLNTNGALDFFYGRMAAPQRYRQDLDAIMEGALDGVEEGLRLNINYSVKDIESIYAGFALTPSAIPREVFHIFDIDDDFSGNGVLNPTTLFGL
ncbi:hypothetical protein PS3A_02130 [Pseudomonas sp. 3A(2025)]